MIDPGFDPHFSTKNDRIKKEENKIISKEAYTNIDNAILAVASKPHIKSSTVLPMGTELDFKDGSALWIFKGPDGIVRARLIDNDVPGLQTNKKPTSTISVSPMVNVNFGSAVVMHNGLDVVFVEFPCGKRVRMSCSADGEVTISGQGRQLMLFNGHMAKFK